MMTAAIPLLREGPLYVFLSLVNIVITEMLADFLFRGLDRMEVITIRFVAAKLISTLLTFVFIKADADILLIPIFDILGSVVALVLVLLEIKKMEIKIKWMPIKMAVSKLKESAVYFISDMATTAFGAMNTLLVGIVASKTDVSYWSLCMQLVAAVQSMYSPISNGIYPTMLRTRSKAFLKKVFLIFMPCVVVGCVICVVFASTIVTIVGGEKYTEAADVFRALVPVLFFSFPSILFGWPALGAIGRQKETTRTTVITALLQIAGLAVLTIHSQWFTLTAIAVLRGATEFFMMCYRGGLCYKFRNEFAK